MSARELVLLHAYWGTPELHWYPWLGRTLASEGWTVRMPQLPDPESPDPVVWADAASTALDDVGDGAIVVAHSLGTTAALRAVARAGASRRWGGFVSVAGFGEPLPLFPELDGFFTPSLPFDEVRRAVPRRIVLRSDDDPLVPRDIGDRFDAALDAERVVVAGAGHFSDRDGVLELPALADMVRTLG